jgi:hypothetical protein
MPEGGGTVDDIDVKIAYGLMASALMEDAGIQGINEAMNQQDPVPIVASMVAALVKELAQGTKGTEIEMSPDVWLAENGAVDQVIDLIGEISGIEMEEQMAGAIFSDVVDQIKLFSTADKQKAQGGGGQPPPMDQGAPPPMEAPPMPEMMPV